MADQERGIGFLFNLIVAKSGQGAIVHTERDIETRRKALLDQVENLRVIAVDIFRLSPEHSNTIKNTADALETLARGDLSSDIGILSDKLIVKRNRTEPELRGFVKLVVETFEMMFGSPFYSTVATITNVALNRRDITRERVRELVRD